MNDDTLDTLEPGERGEDLAAVRDLVLRAHPDTVPELISGGTITDLLASVEPAREAYRRVLDAAQATPTAPTVPAGAAPALVVDPDRLPPTEKIRRGLAGRAG